MKAAWLLPPTPGTIWRRKDVYAFQNPPGSPGGVRRNEN